MSIYSSDLQAMINALMNQQNSGPVGRGELGRLLLAMGEVQPALAGTPATGVTAVEWGNDYHRQTILTVNSVLPAIAGGANLGVGKLLYTFPAGRILVNSAGMSMGVTQTEGHINADTPDAGLGTVIASGAVAVLGGTATFENLINGAAMANCTGTALVSGNVPTAGVPFLIAAADAHTVHFNIADGWAASGDAAAILQGVVVLDWTHQKFA